MANLPKTIGVTILFLLGAGAIAGGFLSGNVIDSQLQQGIEDSIVDSKNHENYEDWKTTEDEGDTPLYKRYFFWNMTNPQEFMGGAIPTYEEIGPYVYRQFDRKLDVSFDGPLVSYTEYTYYVYDDDMTDEESGMDLSEDDQIYNINPQYIGLIDAVGSEKALLTGFVGPTIENILAGLSTDFTRNVQVQGTADAMQGIRDGLLNNFVEGVYVLGYPTVLQSVRTGVTENFQFAVNATTAANVMNDTWHNIGGTTNSTHGNVQLFNNYTLQADLGTPIQSVSEWATSGTFSLGFSNDSITKLLWTGVPSEGLPIGWLSDLNSGQGVLGFLELYESAINEEDGLDNSTLQSAYGLAQSQLDAAAGYLTTYLIEDNAVIEGAFQLEYGISTQTRANQMYFAQWANSSITSELDLNDDDNPDNFEVNFPVGVNISLAVAESMYDPTNSLALTNDTTGIQTWFGAAQGDTTAYNAINSTFGLNDTQMMYLLTWLSEFKDAFVEQSIISNFAPLGITEEDDIGYFQFGDSTISEGASLFHLDDDTDHYPEFWAWSQFVDGSSATLSLDNSINLLNGTYNLTDTESVGAFLLYGSQAGGGNETARGILNSLFNTTLTTQEAGLLTAFLGYIRNTFVLDVLPVEAWEDLQYFHWGNGAVTSGASVFDINPETGFYPEFWAYAQNIAGDTSSNSTLTLEQSKTLLNGSTTLTNTDNVEIFLGSLLMGNYDFINDTWGINETQANLLAGYFDYLIANPISAELQPLIGIEAAGGMVANRAVHEWLWDGVDPLLAFLDSQSTDNIDASANLFANATSPDDTENIDPLSTFNTGSEDLEQKGQYVNWQGNTTVTVWQSDEEVVGTDATEFAPGVEKSENLTAWVSDILRSVEFTFSEDTIVEQIDLYRYVLSEPTLASQDEYPANAKYYQTLKGMANMTSDAGIPFFLSKPHFLDAEETLGLGMGMNPNRDSHETYVDVEPITGVVMNARKRLQLSFGISPSDYFTQNILDTIVPLAWVEEGATISEDQAASFREAVYGAFNLQKTLQVFGPVLGGLLIMTAVVTVVRPGKS